MTMVEMIVNMDCEGCERKVRKALQNLKGVQSVDIDLKLQKVIVTGWVNQEKVLKKVRRTGKKAELWPFPNNPGAIGFTTQYSEIYRYHRNPATYFHVQQPFASSYNYYDNEHGYNGYGYHESGSSSSLTDVGERARIAFSDENVNGCSIM